MSTTSTTHVRPDEGVRYPMIDGDHVVKAAVHEADGAFEVFEVHSSAGPAAPAHVSPWAGVLYLLDGALTAWVDGDTYDVEPGGLVTMPAGVPCTFSVPEGEARFLAITSGNGAARFFADFARAVSADRPVEESMTEIMAVTARHGVSLAGT
ncbi:cupin domain-containing protein [Cellulomonas fimi]|uniref:Cupin domain-containing protein n=1 Tax=Cellulomonas fimi TaxID=1708 RepID=A0A7Y0LXP3_CELFI|nr:cupin domain-containing protein [Cellulomonas fimi]NMR20093.1 cupin domain-containing protein [Cellulomonas fimi]